MKIKDITEKKLTVAVKGGEVVAEQKNGIQALAAATKAAKECPFGTVIQIKAGKALLGIVKLVVDLTEK